MATALQNSLSKQLTLPPDVNEVSQVTMQKEILTPPKVPPASLDRLEEMQDRLNRFIKTKQNVHPRTIVAYVNDTLSGVTPWTESMSCLQNSS